MPEQPTIWPVRLTAWLLVGFIILPSLTDQDFLSLPQHGLSLDHYRELFADGDWLAAFARSAVIAAFAMALAVVVGGLAAFGCWRLPPASARWVQAVMLAPLVIPTIIQGLAYYRLWVDLGLVNTYAGVVLAHAVMATPFVFITVSAALSNVDPRLEMAARGLGAGALRTMAWVLAPIVAPGLLSGALFAFVQSFDELVVVLFITTRGLDTLPKKMWMSLQDDLTPVIACVSVALGALTLALLLLEFALRARGDRIVRAA
jgi:putative spermidine/putrescine transport system permease protein